MIFTQTHGFGLTVLCRVLFTDHAVKWGRSLPSPLIIGGSFQSREEGVGVWLEIGLKKKKTHIWCSVWAILSLPPQSCFVWNTQHDQLNLWVGWWLLIIWAYLSHTVWSQLQRNMFHRPAAVWAWSKRFRCESAGLSGMVGMAARIDNWGVFYLWGKL